VAQRVPLISGTAMLSLRHYLETRHGPAAMGVVASKLPPDHAKEFLTQPSPLAWYPTVSYLAALDVTCTEFGGPGFYEKYGEASSDFAIQRFYAFVLRFLDPLWALSRGVKMWNRYHNTGVWQIVPGPRSMHGTLREFGVVHRGYCEVMVGFFRRTGSRSGGGEAIQVTHTACRARGAEACVFVGVW
jgi:hypothetical protein